VIDVRACAVLQYATRGDGGDTLHLDLVALDVEGLLGAVGVFDLERDLRAARAADLEDGLLLRPALGRFAIDGEDDVAGLDAGAFRGRAFDRRDDDDLVVRRGDGGTDAFEGAAGTDARFDGVRVDIKDAAIGER